MNWKAYPTKLLEEVAAKHGMTTVGLVMVLATGSAPSEIQADLDRIEAKAKENKEE